MHKDKNIIWHAWSKSNIELDICCVINNVDLLMVVSQFVMYTNRWVCADTQLSLCYLGTVSHTHITIA